MMQRWNFHHEIDALEEARGKLLAKKDDPITFHIEDVYVCRYSSIFKNPQMPAPKAKRPSNKGCCCKKVMKKDTSNKICKAYPIHNKIEAARLIF